MAMPAHHDSFQNGKNLSRLAIYLLTDIHANSLDMNHPPSGSLDHLKLCYTLIRHSMIQNRSDPMTDYQLLYIEKIKQEIQKTPDE
jgi:hypothetical protein